jgi:hypothetical protein
MTFPSSYSFVVVVYDVQCCSKPLYLIAFNSLVHSSSRRIVYTPCQICLFIVDIAVPKMLTYSSVHSARPSTLDLRYMVQFVIQLRVLVALMFRTPADCASLTHNPPRVPNSESAQPPTRTWAANPPMPSNIATCIFRDM